MDPMNGLQLCHLELSRDGKLVRSDGWGPKSLGAGRAVGAITVPGSGFSPCFSLCDDARKYEVRETTPVDAPARWTFDLPLTDL
jgi:hypothetical protein